MGLSSSVLNMLLVFFFFLIVVIVLFYFVLFLFLFVLFLAALLRVWDIWLLDAGNVCILTYQSELVQGLLGSTSQLGDMPALQSTQA